MRLGNQDYQYNFKVMFFKSHCKGNRMSEDNHKFVTYTPFSWEVIQFVQKLSELKCINVFNSLPTIAMPAGLSLGSYDMTLVMLYGVFFKVNLHPKILLSNTKAGKSFHIQPIFNRICTRFSGKHDQFIIFAQMFRRYQCP